MGYTVENYCVGCPQGCIHCGRDRDITIYFCDACGDDFEMDQKIYVGLHGEELCKICYLKQFERKEPEEGEGCENCGYEDDYLYLVDGEWICEDCVMKNAEELTFDDCE